MINRFNFCSMEPSVHASDLHLAGFYIQNHWRRVVGQRTEENRPPCKNSHLKLLWSWSEAKLKVVLFNLDSRYYEKFSIFENSDKRLTDLYFSFSCRKKICSYITKRFLTSCREKTSTEQKSSTPFIMSHCLDFRV